MTTTHHLAPDRALFLRALELYSTADECCELVYAAPELEAVLRELRRVAGELARELAPETEPSVRYIIV